MQTAANPVFQPSLLHSQLYRKYVLEEEYVPGVPNQPPQYLNQEFFDVIKKVKRESAENIITMTEGDWTKLLTNEFITMELNNVTSTSQFRPSRIEVASTTTDWTGPYTDSLEFLPI